MYPTEHRQPLRRRLTRPCVADLPGVVRRELAVRPPRDRPQERASITTRRAALLDEVRIEGLLVRLATLPGGGVTRSTRYAVIAWSTQALGFWKATWP